MPVRHIARGILPALLAIALPLTAPAALVVGPGSYAIVATNGPGATGPFVGSAFSGALPADAVDGVIEASADFGSGGYGRGYMTEDGVTFGAVVEAPNQLTGEPVLARGGFVKVEVERYFRKTTEDDVLGYIFSGFELRVGHEPEFAPRCPSGQNDCLQAGWESVATIWKFDGPPGGTPGENQKFFANVGSNPDLPTGYYFAEQEPGFLVVDINVGPNGATMITPPSQNPAVRNVGRGTLTLEDIAVNEIFRATFLLTAWAYDGASNSGPGRTAFAFVQDPLDPNFGIGFELGGGLEAVSPVPGPASLWLLATALVPVWRMRRV